jgi:hypothetical protein
MAKWSMRIEMQTMDIEKSCPIYGKIHSSWEIFDGFGCFLYRKRGVS